MFCLFFCDTAKKNFIYDGGGERKTYYKYILFKLSLFVCGYYFFLHVFECRLFDGGERFFFLQTKKKKKNFRILDGGGEINLVSGKKKKKKTHVPEL